MRKGYDNRAGHGRVDFSRPPSPVSPDSDLHEPHRSSMIRHLHDPIHPHFFFEEFDCSSVKSRSFTGEPQYSRYEHLLSARAMDPIPRSATHFAVVLEAPEKLHQSRLRRTVRIRSAIYMLVAACPPPIGLFYSMHRRRPLSLSFSLLPIQPFQSAFFFIAPIIQRGARVAMERLIIVCGLTDIILIPRADP